MLVSISLLIKLEVTIWVATASLNVLVWRRRTLRDTLARIEYIRVFFLNQKKTRKYVLIVELLGVFVVCNRIKLSDGAEPPDVLDRRTRRRWATGTDQLCNVIQLVCQTAKRDVHLREILRASVYVHTELARLCEPKSYIERKVFKRPRIEIRTDLVYDEVALGEIRKLVQILPISNRYAFLDFRPMYKFVLKLQIRYDWSGYACFFQPS